MAIKDQNIIVSNARKLKKVKQNIFKSGAIKLHFLTDFDRTLTKAFIGGKNTPSLISILRDCNYLNPNYSKKAHALYDKYHPIEINPAVPIEDKKKAMLEWWKAHFNLLIKSGLSKNDIEKIARSKKIKLRKGAKKLIQLLYKRNIPVVIISSSGLGEEIISLFLKNKSVFYKNIHIVSNSFRWNKNGKAICIKEPIIHCLNKEETILKKFPFFNQIKNRKNVILLGDNLEDIDMAKGFSYDNLLKIGFLNENIDANLSAYKKSFDIVIKNDSSMDFICDFIEQVME
jgi:5'-nucleotidase